MYVRICIYIYVYITYEHIYSDYIYFKYIITALQKNNR